MRTLVAVSALTFVLAACGQGGAPDAPPASTEPAAPVQAAPQPAPQPAPAAQPAPAPRASADPVADAGRLAARFLQPATAHAITYTISDPGSPDQIVTMRRDGARQRYETLEDGVVGVVVVDFAAERVLAFQTGDAVPADDRVVTVIPYGQFGGMGDFGLDSVVSADARANKTGQDTVAGERCDLWRIEDADGEVNEICVTGDDIVLRAGKSGAKPDMIATAFTRGPQSDDVFAPPQGYQVLDMGAMLGALGAAAQGADFDEDALRALLNTPQN